MENNDYDIRKAFATIENELLDSMIRNMKRHRAEETEEGFEWSQWQAEQLRSLESYRRRHKEKLGERYGKINTKIQESIRMNNELGQMDQEKKILRAIKNGFTLYEKPSDKMTGEFFRMNEKKMDALVQATTKDMERAEHAIFRMHDDKYRKVIFNAQVYAASGAGTYEKAVDMAVKDYARAGINCIRYSDGRMVNIKDYADMALRTANKRAYLQGEGVKRQEMGVHTVIINKRMKACPLCLPWVGRVLVDDIYSGGTRKEALEGDYALLSEAMAAGLYHPNCRDVHSTYFPGISRPTDKRWKRSELEEIRQKYGEEQQEQHARRQAEKYERMERLALDADNQRIYREKKEEWERRAGKRVMPHMDMSEKEVQEYSKEVIEKMTQELDNIANKHVSKKGKWSGNIVIDDESKAAGKLWNCDIQVSKETSPHIILHELLHAKSISYYDIDTYIQHRKIEESVVQLAAQEISKKEDIGIIESQYDVMCDALRHINDKLQCKKDNYAFAIMLLEMNVLDRKQWLEKRLNEAFTKAEIAAGDYLDIKNILEEVL